MFIRHSYSVQRTFPAPSIPIFRNGFFIFILLMFFFTLGDATMSFSAPILMANKLGATQMGLILGSSSVIGAITDILFARFFGQKKPRFFVKIMLGLTLLFPVSFLLFHSVPVFLFGMLVWGVYFEAMLFSAYHMIHETVQAKDHIWAWSALALVRNIGWVVGPLIASYLDSMNGKYPYYFAIFAFATAIFLFFFHKTTTKKIHVAHAKKYKPRGLRQELKIWYACTKVFWPVMFMLFMFEIIDSTFFSIGPVFAESLFERSPLGNLFITMYTLPTLIFGVLSGVLARPFGKKKAAFGAGIVAGIGLIALSQVHSVELILATTFFSAMGTAIIFPETSAIFEDFVGRGKGYSNDIVGLTAIISSVAYTVGPVINGYLFDQVGTQKLFGLWGVIIILFSIFALFTVKRKLKLPQAEVSYLLHAKKR